ncbi:CIR protein PIR protein [Plasmodium vinckei brucechwatti]|uniref:CIR protein PIR protein n=1 Tax=Plasmodium vinckei brucechwatti TaxID=119398 RepID=A0A6V7RSZ3_PLAVN|nr:CIR protein PIR protein [Plasmodium vinckei brucechwatti]
MAKYSIEDLYRDIYKIDRYFYEKKVGGLTIQRTDPKIHNYCHYRNNSGQGKCQNYIEMASSGVIHLLKNLKKYNLEDDKLAEYAILWLRYKLNQKEPFNNTKLNDFCTNHIEKNNDYNKKINDNDLTYKEIIYKKKDLMNINEMTKFSYPFNLLLYLYNANKLNCANHSIQAKEFANRFKGFDKDPNNIEGSSYNKILSTISNDYDHLKKKCDKFPSLPIIEPKNRPSENLVVNPVGNSGHSSGKPTALNSEVTSSSSSILSTLIPGLSVVSVIPVFLGIAYKYSLFGFDKRFHRQYLREKIKKIKKKMNNYI